MTAGFRWNDEHQTRSTVEGFQPASQSTQRTHAELIQSADARLYEAKRAGRNCCRIEEAMGKAA